MTALTVLLWLSAIFLEAKSTASNLSAYKCRIGENCVPDRKVVQRKSLMPRRQSLSPKTFRPPKRQTVPVLEQRFGYDRGNDLERQRERMKTEVQRDTRSELDFKTRQRLFERTYKNSAAQMTFDDVIRETKSQKITVEEYEKRTLFAKVLTIFQALLQPNLDPNSFTKGVEQLARFLEYGHTKNLVAVFIDALFRIQDIMGNQTRMYRMLGMKNVMREVFNQYNRLNLLRSPAAYNPLLMELICETSSLSNPILQACQAHNAHTASGIR